MNLAERTPNLDLVAYVEALVRLTKRGTYYFGPCPICGGRDRFVIKRGAHDLWICRKCSDGKYHSALDFLMAYHKIDLQEALQRMGSEAIQVDRTTARPNLKTPKPVQVIPPQDWQARAWQQIDRASDQLLDSRAGEAGRRYLMERGISLAAMYMWLLGYGTVFGRPAIYIPYLDVGNLITAVKYRFIDSQASNDKGTRFAMMAGSLPCLFGLQHVLRSDHILLFVEGELNAVSVLQTLPRRVSVVSAGSESNGHTAILHALVARYERVVIWMDDPTKAAMIQRRMGRDVKLIKSPLLDGRKWDANEMLKAGLLMDFLERQLSAHFLGIPPAGPQAQNGDTGKV